MLFSEEIVKKRLPIMLTSWENLRIINMENWQFATGKKRMEEITHETLEGHIRTVLASFCAGNDSCLRGDKGSENGLERSDCHFCPAGGKQSTLPTMFQKITL